MSTSWVVDDLVDDAAELFDGPLDDLVAVLEEIASLGDVEAPTPSAELALLLAGRPAAPHRQVRHRRRVAPALGGLAAAAVAGLTLTGTAAYANELPPSVQRVVAHLSEDYLPFTFPRPVGDPPAPDPASPRGGAGSRSSGGAAPSADPSAVAESGVVPVGPSAGGPTDRADGRLPHRDVRKPERVRPSAARPPAPLRSADGTFGASTVEEDLTAAVTMTPAAPSPQGWEVTAAPTTPTEAPTADPQGAPSGATSAPAGPSPSTAPSPDPSPDPTPAPSSDPASPQPTTPSSGTQPSPTSSSGTPADAGTAPAGGKTASQSPGPEPTPVTGTATTPPASPSDPAGSQPAGPGSRSPDTAASSPAVGSGGSPAADVVTDPGTAGSAAPTTPVP